MKINNKFIKYLSLLFILCVGFYVFFIKNNYVEGLDPPDGTYKNSCNNVIINNDMLIANCRARIGIRKLTTLNLKTCNIPLKISNLNGKLMCAKSTHKPATSTRDIPIGSYTQSCSGMYLNDNNILEATCKTEDGKDNNSTLNLNKCRQPYDIFNYYGTLGCEYPNSTDNNPVSQTPKYPEGDYRNTCSNIEPTGGSDPEIKAYCSDSNGQLLISKLRLNTCKDDKVINKNGYLKCKNEKFFHW
jgi:hypothetical protein